MFIPQLGSLAPYLDEISLAVPIRVYCRVLLLITSILLVLVGVDAVASNFQGAVIAASKKALGPEDVAIIVNDADSLSVRVAKYYKVKRRIPDKNIVHVRFRPGVSVMARTEFQRVKATVDAATPANVQVYALTWTLPYRVECMSVTTAFAAGFDPAFCSKSCGATKYSPYFNSESRRPYNDYGWRPTISLAGLGFANVKKLIDRGIASDRTYPHGTGYLVSTSDKARNVRSGFYPEIIEQFLGSWFDLRLAKKDYISHKNNVLFYFTGVASVKALDSIRFVPGAIADHLTSAGGKLTDSEQMSSLRWLEAGATGSYGTVVEPCNLPDKFPNPGIVINRYLNGETLIEAYWKSVAMPGEGIFIGEPLASPYRR